MYNYDKNKFTYICSNCGKEFSRGYEFGPEEKILCHGCGIKEFYKNHPEKSKERFQKTQQTNLQKYGNTNAAKNEEVRTKISNNLLDAYQDKKEDILSKRTATNREKFGFDYPAQNSEIQKKAVEVQRANNGFVGWENKEYQQAAERQAHSIEAEDKRRQTNIKNYGRNTIVQDKENSNRLKGYIYEDLKFDSSWELAIYIWCQDHDKAVIYHPQVHFEYKDELGRIHIYWPDFLIEGQFYETKGEQFFNDLGEPYNRYTKTYWWSKYNALTKNNVKILRVEDMKPYLRYVNIKYGKNYLKSFKVSSK